LKSYFVERLRGLEANLRLKSENIGGQIGLPGLNCQARRIRQNRMRLTAQIKTFMQKAADEKYFSSAAFYNRPR